MPFPLFDLPPEAVELVLRCVDGLEDKRALRLTCKRTCASVDSRVTAVSPRLTRGNSRNLALVPQLVGAPWHLQRLDLDRSRYTTGCTSILGPRCAAALALADWPAQI